MQNVIKNISDTWTEIRVVSKVLSARDRWRFFKCLQKNLPGLIKEHSFRSIDACIDEKDKMLEVGCLGMKYNLSDFGFCSVREIYARKIYFPDDDWVPNEDDAVIDLGANVGMFTLLCAKRGADVVAVEAQDGFVPCIKKNLTKNNCLDRVSIIHGLIGSGSGVFSNEYRIQEADHYAGTTPDQIPIEDVFNIFANRRIHLIKIDIEGSEFALFDGELEWLSVIDRIAMEVHPHFGDVRKIICDITAMGFKCQLRTPTMHPVENVVDTPGLLFCKRSF